MMKDLQEKVLILTVILLFSFWYVFTGYLIFDHFAARWQIYAIGILLLSVIIVACLHTVKKMKHESMLGRSVYDEL